MITLGLHLIGVVDAGIVQGGGPVIAKRSNLVDRGR
jgi:hypothetical protein